MLTTANPPTALARTSSSPPMAAWPNGDWSRCLRARSLPARATRRTEPSSSSTTRRKDAGGTPAPQRKIQLAPCGAPELKPDAALVVLPLPLRSRQQVLEARKLLSDQAYDRWSDEDALAVIAADLGEYPAEMKQIIGQRFFRHGDRRLGSLHPAAQHRADMEPQGKAGFPGRRSAPCRSAGRPSP